MFEPKINKSAPPRPKKNSLFYASCRMQDPDLGNFLIVWIQCFFICTLKPIIRGPSTKVGLVQTTDWYKRWTVQMSDQYKIKII